MGAGRRAGVRCLGPPGGRHGALLLRGRVLARADRDAPGRVGRRGRRVSGVVQTTVLITSTPSYLPILSSYMFTYDHHYELLLSLSIILILSSPLLLLRLLLLLSPSFLLPLATSICYSHWRLLLSLATAITIGDDCYYHIITICDLLAPAEAAEGLWASRVRGPIVDYRMIYMCIYIYIYI